MCTYGGSLTYASWVFVKQADLCERPFFPALCEFLSSSPVVAMVWCGTDIVKQGYAAFFFHLDLSGSINIPNL